LEAIISLSADGACGTLFLVVARRIEPSSISKRAHHAGDPSASPSVKAQLLMLDVVVVA